MGTLETLAGELESEGYAVQFVVVADHNASDFVEETTRPIFRDAGSGRPAWEEMTSDATKHDTFVYSETGQLTLFWDASARDLGDWPADIRLAVEAQ